MEIVIQVKLTKYVIYQIMNIKATHSSQNKTIFNEKWEHTELRHRKKHK